MKLLFVVFRITADAAVNALLLWDIRSLEM